MWCVCKSVRASMRLWRVSSENSLVELDFLKALSLQRWIECKICKALWKIAGEKEESVKKNWCLGGWQVLVEGTGSYITKSFWVGGSKNILWMFSWPDVHIKVLSSHRCSSKTVQRSEPHWKAYVSIINGSYSRHQ